MTANALGLLGLARKAGRLELGEEPAGAACRSRKARLALLACDAADNCVRRAQRLCQEGGVPLVRTPWTKEELGGQLGRASCAVLAVTDSGLAAAFLEKLDDPGRWGEDIRRLEEEAGRARRAGPGSGFGRSRRKRS